MKILEKFLTKNHSDTFFEDWIEFLQKPDSNFIEKDWLFICNQII